MKYFLWVFLGGGLGSVLRYGVSKFIPFQQNTFPYPTLIANLLGCLLIGFIMGSAIKHETLSSSQTLFFATGFCGGLTTFSTFSLEGLELLKSGNLGVFLFYTLISIILGLLAVGLGIYLSRSI
jgi:CrcB protein